MDSNCLVAVFETVPKANVGLEVLAKAGFDRDQVSAVSRNDLTGLTEVQKLQAQAQVTAEDTRVADGHEASATAPGTGLGAALGSAAVAPIAVGSLVFPLFIAGPLLGAGFGAILGGLFDSDKDVDNGPSYSEHVSSGAILVIVTGDEDQLREAKASLKTCGPIVLDEYETGANEPE